MAPVFHLSLLAVIGQEHIKPTSSLPTHDRGNLDMCRVSCVGELGRQIGFLILILFKGFDAQPFLPYNEKRL